MEGCALLCSRGPGAWWLAAEGGFGILGFQEEGLGVFPSRIRVALAASTPLR